MSTFLVNISQGTGRNRGGSLDDRTLAGSSSVSRTIMLPGPHGVMRSLNEGETFTDSSYWLRYTYPYLPYEQASLTCTANDSVPWVDGQDPQNGLITTSLSVVSGSTYTDTANILDVYTAYSGYSNWCTISPSGTVTCKINGNSNSIFTITGGTTQTFNPGDILISSLAFAKSTSGTSTVTIQLGVAAFSAT